MITFLQKHLRKPGRGIIVLLFAASLWQLATAGWIQGKALLAQQLLNHSWEKAANDTTKYNPPAVHRPWPWADTWPVAKLLVPRYHIEQIVLAGDSGSSLAFGPAHALASARPGTSGTSMISGHRDTHFSFLQQLKLNDTVLIQSADKTISYRVNDFKIVDSSSYRLPLDSEHNVLVLVTCYPFNGISDSTQRYLVYATEQQLEINGAEIKL